MNRDVFKDFQGIFACPKCNSVFSDFTAFWFFCYKCKVKFPVKNGVPVLLVENAEPILSDDIDIPNRNWNK